MRIKRIFALVVLGVLTTGMLTGCDGGPQMVGGGATLDPGVTDGDYAASLEEESGVGTITPELIPEEVTLEQAQAFYDEMSTYLDTDEKYKGDKDSKKQNMAAFVFANYTYMSDETFQQIISTYFKDAGECCNCFGQYFRSKQARNASMSVGEEPQGSFDPFSSFESLYVDPTLKAFGKEYDEVLDQAVKTSSFWVVSEDNTYYYELLGYLVGEGDMTYTWNDPRVSGGALHVIDVFTFFLVRANAESYIAEDKQDVLLGRTKQVSEILDTMNEEVLSKAGQ